MRRGQGFLIAALAALAALPASAGAAETLGATGPPTVVQCYVDSAYVSPEVAAVPDFVADAPGVITSWKMLADSTDGQRVQVIVLRRTPPLTYTKVGADEFRALTPSTLNRFTGVRVPIAAGEYVGVWIPEGPPFAASCLTTTSGGDRHHYYSIGDPPFGTPVTWTDGGTSYRLNLEATVEPDADGDGFGDETQDACPASAFTQSPCICKGRTATIAGGPGNDRLRGTPGADVIMGFAGRDAIKGLTSKDRLCGGPGRDRVIGGKGKDTLVGGPGRDRLIGGKGKDKLIGGPGRDAQRQ